MTLVALPSPAAFDYSHRGDYPDTRPIITVEFAAADTHGVLLGAHRTGVLVDSGADLTILEYGVAVALGLDLRDEARHPRVGIGGIAGGLLCARATIMAELCGSWLTIPVMFPVPPRVGLPPPNVQNCLGRDGVFDHVGFAFGRAEKAVYHVMDKTRDTHHALQFPRRRRPAGVFSCEARSPLRGARFVVGDTVCPHGHHAQQEKIAEASGR